MIDNILGNRTCILVLRFLTKFENQFFSADEISKATGAGLRNVYDALASLSYERIASNRFTKGKIYYKFRVDSSVKKSISLIFEDERTKVWLHHFSLHFTFLYHQSD